MERELRLQEDRIYELEDELERHCKLLEACRQENQALKSARAATEPATRRDPDTSSPTERSAPARTPPPISDDELQPPQVEIDLPPVPPPDSSGDSLPSLRDPELNGPGMRDAPPRTMVEPESGSAAPEPPLRIRINAGDEARPPARTGPRVARENASPEREKAPKKTPTAQRPRWSPYR
jgi:hypothetical protein